MRLHALPEGRQGHQGLIGAPGAKRRAAPASSRGRSPFFTSASGLDWTYGIPGARIAEALREWQANELPGGHCQMLNASDGDIATLFMAFGIDVRAQLYTMVVQALGNGEYNVVDGQQRLTTLAIILHALGISSQWEIEYKAESGRPMLAASAAQCRWFFY